MFGMLAMSYDYGDTEPRSADCNAEHDMVYCVCICIISKDVLPS